MDTFRILRVGEERVWREIVRRPAVATEPSASASSRPLVAAFNMAREEFRLMETPVHRAAACRPASSARVVRRIHIT
uniref:Uncharacterized protein n=1 Tax=Oryza barthii TaxID=65489 RepID=A0A0D3FIV6_9ORYZ